MGVEGFALCRQLKDILRYFALTVKKGFAVSTANKIY